MGYATIIDGGTDGRYTIRLDYGEARRVAIVDALQQKLSIVEASIADAQALVNAGEVREAQQIASINSYIEALEVEMATLPPGSPFPDADGYTTLLRDLRAIQAANAPNRIALAAFKAIKAQTRKELAAFNALQTIETRQAWCADFTEDASGQVATLDIPGESSLLLIAPRGRVWIPSIDGALAARELMSPAQVFFNAAILPGWQIDRPTYRWGTLTFIDWDGNTGNVTLGEAVSSAQRLPVNDRATLAGVPFDYMESDCRAFSDDSRVVVDLRQGWEAPKIIGFLDNPRPDPPTANENATWQRTLTQDEAVSSSYAGHWTGGANPRTYTVHEGSLPPGVSLDSSTGLLSGTPTGPGLYEDIIFRCSDTFYDAEKNRRYDDSPPFDIGVFGGWEFFDGVMDDAFHQYGAGTIFVEVYFAGDATTSSLEVRKVATGGLDEVIDDTLFVTGIDEFGFPELWCRFDAVGDQPNGTSSSTGEWLEGVNWSWMWRIDAAEPGTSYEATYTMRIATDAAGVNVVSTVTGYVFVELLP